MLRPGVAALVKCLALELAPRVRVNSIVPGRIDTERVRFLDENRAEATGVSPAEQRAQNERTIAMGRYGEQAPACVRTDRTVVRPEQDLEPFGIGGRRR